MITDLISRLPLYGAVIPGAERIAAAFAAGEPGLAPCEVRVKAYATKADGERRFEVHFHTIDLMVAREGAEVISLCPMECLEAAEALPNGADGRKLNGPPQGSHVLLEGGSFCAIFPGEAHMVGGRFRGEAGNIDKWVVKVPCAAPFRAEEST